MLLSITQIATFDEMLELARPEAARRVAQLEGPQEVASLLEVRSDGVNLVDEVLHAHDTVLAQVGLDQGIVGERDALLVDLTVTALVDELTHGLEIGIAIGDVRLHGPKHLQSGLGHPHEDTVVDLDQTKQLEDLARLGGNLVDTE